MAEANHSLPYRPEIDGLRALAVVPVVLFHAGIPGFSGGYIGVDVFFVISGFLITQILVRDIDAGNFRLTNFYMRRASRLLPALFLVLLACIAYMLILQPPFAARDLAQSVAATALYLQNMLLISESSTYFSLESDLKPLLHTWSLAVEEQYYVLCPAILLLLTRFGLSLRQYILIALCGVGLIATSLIAIHHPAVAFYALPTRGWELILGAAAGLSFMASTSKTATFRENFLAGFGLILILGSIILLTPSSGVPGWAALPAALGTAMVLVYAKPGGGVAQVLGFRPFVWIGLGSYSAYLWHQPVLAFERTELSLPEGALSAALFVAVLGGLTWLTYQLVETPFRTRKVPVQLQVALFSALTLGCVGIGVAGHATHGFETFKVRQIPEARRHLFISHREELAKVRSANRRADQEDATNPRNADYVILGDSMARDLHIAMKLAGKDAIRVPLEVECYQDLLTSRQACGFYLAGLLERLRPHRTVILAGNFAKLGDNPSIPAFYRRLEEAGLQVRLLGSLKVRNGSNMSYQYARSDMSSEAFARRAYQTLSPETEVNAYLRETLAVEALLDKYGLFCDDKAEACRLYSEEGDAYFYDAIHVTLAGAEYLASRIDHLLETGASN